MAHTLQCRQWKIHRRRFPSADYVPPPLSNSFREGSYGDAQLVNRASLFRHPNDGGLYESSKGLGKVRPYGFVAPFLDPLLQTTQRGGREHCALMEQLIHDDADGPNAYGVAAVAARARRVELGRHITGRTVRVRRFSSVEHANPRSHSRRTLSFLISEVVRLHAPVCNAACRCMKRSPWIMFEM